MTKGETAKPDSDIVPIGDFSKRSVRLNWPEPVRDALDELVEAAGESDVKTSRSELVAALVFIALKDNREDNQLDAIIGAYRNTKIMYLDTGEEE